MKKYDVRKVVSSLMKSFSTEYATESRMEMALERALRVAETEVEDEPNKLLRDQLNAHPSMVFAVLYDGNWYWGTQRLKDVEMITLCDIQTGKFHQHVYIKNIADWKTPAAYILNDKAVNTFLPLEHEVEKYQWIFQYNSDIVADIWRRESQYLTLTEARQRHPKATRFMPFNITNCNGVRFVQDW